MAGITTHVLDTALGKPAAGLRITFEVERGGAWLTILEGETDADGRLRILDASRVESATYRITFDTGAYNPGGFFPEAAIVFRIHDVTQHYHVPLLLSPFGYSTYRGS